ncbi:SDR family oxidoreductase [Pseudomonas veronii]|jgi:nucleoside-diphosphate-sugar epimerase|uniref:UDP-glucose 4-epimerase family protein n=1 Tax=Pseudomonas veronii TaxID=76761 RepID=UPI0018E772C9|nr:SDR family oxidoreductase [Pseudomonas veronii]MBJ2176855.1 SDR family oxidoreductase [Pseudomonas veronii]
MKVFLTGITGFVGRAASERLLQAGHQVRGALRDANVPLAKGVDPVVFDDLATHDWAPSLEGQSVVLHCAARVHVMSEQSVDPLSEFRKVNVDGTLNLARHAADMGVKRFIFISSIKVNGEGTEPGRPYSADDAPAPVDPYGVSKWEAEQGLRDLAARTGMEVVIIRPVLVYGPGVKANFLNMMRWLDKGIPLPFGSIHNSRSLVALDNLVDLLVTTIHHPAAANQAFLVSDGEDLSTSNLLRRMAKALGRPARLLAVPCAILSFTANLLGQRSVAQRLCGSLQVDISKTRSLLQWAPPLSVDEALKIVAVHYVESKK